MWDLKEKKKTLIIGKYYLPLWIFNIKRVTCMLLPTHSCTFATHTTLTKRTLTTKKKPTLIILAVRCTLWWANPRLSISCWEMTSPTPTKDPGGQTGERKYTQDNLVFALQLQEKFVFSISITSHIECKCKQHKNGGKNC